MYYYLHIWLPISLLTLPGGAVAFFAKKQNVLGAIILGIGNTIVALMGVSYFLKLYSAFPRHLLTVISCASIIVVLILGMQKRWKTRILSAATTVLLTAGVIIWAVLNERVIWQWGEEAWQSSQHTPLHLPPYSPNNSIKKLFIVKAPTLSNPLRVPFTERNSHIWNEPFCLFLRYACFWPAAVFRAKPTHKAPAQRKRCSLIRARHLTIAALFGTFPINRLRHSSIQCFAPLQIIF